MAKQTDEGSERSLAEEFNRLKKQTQQLLRPYLDLVKLSLKDVNAESLEQIAKYRPNSASLAKELEALSEQFKAFKQHYLAEAQDRFRVAVAEFVRTRQSTGPQPREVGAAIWRVGRLSSAIHAPQVDADRGILDIETDVTRQCARVLYDGEKLLPWSSVTRSSDLDAIVSKAYRQLESQAIPVSEMTEVFASAYDHYLELGRKEGKVDPGLVPILEFYHQVRLELTRRALIKQGPEGKIPFSEFPRWAFLFNLDRYQVIDSWNYPSPRLSLEVGTQATIRQGRCLIVSCLQSQGHRQCCFIKRPLG